jgi:4-amino-4-deoxy-L-arabinose transferase-like glycosyltransferase
MLKRAVWFALPLLVALALRVYSLDFSLPYAVHIDESRFLYSAVHSLQTGDLNPGWFRQPSLYNTLVIGAVGLYSLSAGAAGVLPGAADLFRPPYYFLGVIPVPGEWLAARALTALLGVASVALVMAVAWHAGEGRRDAESPARDWGAWAAGMLLAVSPLHVAHSRFITVDVLAGFVALATVAAAMGIARHGRPSDYLLAGFLAGLAASTKYNLGMVVLVVPVAHVMRWGRASLRQAGLPLAAGLATVAGFVVGTPYALIDRQSFWDDVMYEWQHNVVIGHPGREGSSGRFYADLLLGGPDVWLTVLGLFGFVAGVWPGGLPDRRRTTWLLAAFVVPFAALIALTLVHFDRFAVPLLPPLAVLAGFALQRAGALAAARPQAQSAVVLALLAFPLAASGWASISYGRALREPEALVLANEWVETHVPSGSPVVVETIASSLDPERYRLLQVGRLIDHDASWYREQGYAYFVASGINYEPLFASADRYPQEVAAYRALFDEWELMQVIEGASIGRPGYRIAIYHDRRP